MKLLRILLFVSPLFLFSCSKKGITPSREEPYIAEIHAISYLDTTTDTAWITVDTVEKSFPSPVNEFAIPLFPEVFDSLYLKLDTATVHQLSFKEPIPLPVIAIDDYTLLTYASDSIKMDAFELATGFHSTKERWKSTQTFTGVVNGYRVIYRYKRIYYHFNVEVDVRDNEGQKYVLPGLLEGSVAVTSGTDVNLW